MLPADDRSREMTVARPETDAALPHVAVVGNVYTILVSGRQSGGRYALIDMYVPPGGGAAATPARLAEKAKALSAKYKNEISTA